MYAIRSYYAVADESDMGALVTMVVFNQLSLEECVPTLVDMSLLDNKNNKIGYWHCGGASTKLMKEGAGFEVRNHSILENYSEESSTGPLIEFLHNPGEVTIAKYMYPHADEVLTFEAEIVESEMAFRITSYNVCYTKLLRKTSKVHSPSGSPTEVIVKIASPSGP